MNYEKTIQIANAGTRRELRTRVINEFLQEECGTGRGELACRYTYYVETLSDGRRIFLTRPTRLNKGFDFVIRVEGVDFNDGVKPRRNNPTHGDIKADLERKKFENLEEYEKLYDLIRLVYECIEVDPKHFQKFTFISGYPVDLLVNVIKWLFIEQDVTYWNYSGRAMFMAAIPTPD